MTLVVLLVTTMHFPSLLSCHIRIDPAEADLILACEWAGRFLRAIISAPSLKQLKISITEIPADTQRTSDRFTSALGDLDAAVTQPQFKKVGPKCSDCDLWDNECRYNVRRSSDTVDDVRLELIRKMKAEIDDAVEKITKHTSTPAMPTLATSTENATNAATATDNATSLPSEPATETPKSGSGTPSTTTATVVTRTENVPTETRPRSLVDNVSSVSHSFDLRLSVSGFRRSTLSTARPVLRLRLK